MTKIQFDGKEIDLDEMVDTIEVDTGIPSILQTLENCVSYCAAVAIDTQQEPQLIAELAIAALFIERALKPVAAEHQEPHVEGQFVHKEAMTS